MARRISNGAKHIAKHTPNHSLKKKAFLSKTPPNQLSDSKKITPPLTPPDKMPSASYFEVLKQEESQQFPNRKRKRYTYSDNYSAALGLSCSQVELQKNQNNHGALLDMAKSNIIEHANRRVDLFFYTLIAYYKTSIYPTTGHTDLQHGRGCTVGDNLNLTQACHSSFTPSLVDSTILGNDGREVKHKSLLSGTHLMDNLNATVELPSFVNQLDDVLESACREKCIGLLREVSQGTINPVEGLSKFLNMMKGVLEDLKLQASRRGNSSLNRHSQFGGKPINPKLIDLVYAGTLNTTFSSIHNAVSDEYVQMLLMLTPAEKKLCVQNKEPVYLNKIMKLQTETLASRSGLNHPVV
ncbi:hypothetical protein [uncultured Legionella sp.]|uniref:hypothetical protein n=1 Tax=uncultured Legionella sp. TaxID=210934 RepID=UPI0026344401|nr:hypothetical protein [uncultured Legionella sp.]